VPSTKGSPNIRLGTITRSYLSTLLQYPVEEIAIRAYVAKADGCSPQAAINVPFVAEIGSTADTLVLYVNSGGLDARASLFLSDADEAGGAPSIASAACQPVGERGRIAYNNQCRLALKDVPAGIATLRLDFDDGFSTTKLTTMVSLPGATDR